VRHAACDAEIDGLRTRRANRRAFAEAARELVSEEITRGLRPLVQSQIANALGIKYLVAPDRKTGKFLRVEQAGAGSKTEETIEVWERTRASRRSRTS
jgi:anti-sigma-K factor RskA